MITGKASHIIQHLLPRPLLPALRLRGFPGWFLTRSYHLLQLPLLSRKLRVVTDWTTSLFFRRDIAELSMLGHPRRLGE